MTQTDRETLNQTLQHLTPAEKLEVLEQVARSLREWLRPTSTAAQQREGLAALRRELDQLPVQNPADGFSGRDHDKILYGKNS